MVLAIGNKCHQCFCVAAWRIHCNAVVSPMTHLEFCREIAICLLKSPMEKRTKVTGGTLPSLPKDIRFD